MEVKEKFEEFAETNNDYPAKLTPANGVIYILNQIQSIPLGSQYFRHIVCHKYWFDLNLKKFIVEIMLTKSHSRHTIPYY